MVRAAGLEPARPCGRGILSPLRIPISPRPHVGESRIYRAFEVVSRRKRYPNEPGTRRPVPKESPDIVPKDVLGAFPAFHNMQVASGLAGSPTLLQARLIGPDLHGAQISCTLKNGAA